MSSKPGQYSSLPKPSETMDWVSVNPRCLTPLEAPPVKLSEYPELPSSRLSAFYPGYSVSTHVFPAAFPRCPSDVWIPPPVNESRVEKKERITSTVAFLSSIKEAQEQGRDQRQPSREMLWTVANRYAKTTRTESAGLTLIFLHGIGAHKETWEPVLQRLFSLMEASESSVNIQEVWALDCVQHGDSGMLNEKAMGDTFDCADYSRDLTNFLLSYLPETFSEGQLPTKLSRLPASVADARKHHGFSDRLVVGLGHSVGACAFVYPAVQYPALFKSLVLIESMTIPEYVKAKDAHRKFEAICLGRRWLWNTRESITNDIANSTYYRSWNPDSLRAFIQYATIEMPRGIHRLKTHPYLEAVVLFERLVVYETWELLEQIDPHIFLHWIWGGKSERSGGPSIQAQTTYRRASNSSHDFHPNIGHLLPQEAPDTLATDLLRFMNAQYGRYCSKL